MEQFNAKYHRQRGNTLLGLIIGLVVGLGIAVVVAMMISQNPLPFVDKVVKQERSALPEGRIDDPNRPMYGSRPAERPVIATVPEAAPGAVYQAPEVSTHAMPAGPAATTSAPASPAADKDDGKWIYYLQAGAFRSWNDAEGERARLALMGFEAHITERQAESGTLYRVRLGPYAQVEAMNKMRNKLSDSGIEIAIIRAPK
jgi:cell division protein FtsN